MSNEVADLVQFIYRRLAGDATLASLVKRTPSGNGPGVYEAAGPQNAAYPFVIFTMLSLPDVGGNGATRFATRPLVRIYAVGDTPSLVSLGDIANRIDFLFGERDNLATGQQGDLMVRGSHRERLFAPPPEVADGGTIYRRLGGEYRLFMYGVEG